LDRVLGWEEDVGVDAGCEGLEMVDCWEEILRRGWLGERTGHEVLSGEEVDCGGKEGGVSGVCIGHPGGGLAVSLPTGGCCGGSAEEGEGVDGAAQNQPILMEFEWLFVFEKVDVE
jgi:hypothetical protein